MPFICIACCLDILVVQDEIADAIAIKPQIRVAAQNHIPKLDIAAPGGGRPSIHAFAVSLINKPMILEAANSPIPSAVSVRSTE
jgi:hypothetical protein